MKDNRIEGIASQEETLETTQHFRQWVRGKVRSAICELVEDEVQGLCGTRYHPADEAPCYRAGSAPSSVYIEGGREDLTRPRVRQRNSKGSEEVLLKTWQLARDPEQWEQAMMRAVLCGVSTRKVSLLRESELKGESKSSLSRLWQRKAVELVEEMQQSDLSGIKLLVLMLDAVVLCKDLVATVALGIDTEGIKHVLGFQVGSSENAEVCADLLSSLRRRGLNAPKDRYLFAVLDGSKALKNALLKEYPRTLIQRCLVHKERNIRRYLSAKHWKTLAALFKQLRQSQGAEAGKEAAEAIETFLSDKNAQSRESFEETGEDLLTLFRLNVPNTLHVSLLSTNCIENAFKNLRRHIGRVCRWREETHQADLWLASGLSLANKGFRKIRGVKELPDLIQALEQKLKNDTQVNEA